MQPPITSTALHRTAPRSSMDVQSSRCFGSQPTTGVHHETGGLQRYPLMLMRAFFSNLLTSLCCLGKAINDTFKLNNAGAVASVVSKCTDGVASVVPTGEFDYIVSAEDLQHGQRIGNYSVEYRRKGSSTWEVLVPPVQAAVNTTASTTITASNIRARVADRPVRTQPLVITPRMCPRTRHGGPPPPQHRARVGGAPLVGRKILSSGSRLLLIASSY